MAAVYISAFMTQREAQRVSEKACTADLNGERWL
jgi:hypothetical protein